MRIRKSNGKKPSKKDLNLFYKVDRAAKPLTVVLYSMFTVLCLLCIAKFFIYDIWIEDMNAKTVLADTELEFLTLQRQLSNYQAIREEYQRYAATDEELEIVDRMEILGLIDDAVGAVAEVDLINIKDNTVTVRFSGVTLQQSSEIVRHLEESDMVLSVMVSTANTDGVVHQDGVDAASKPISALAVIELTRAGDEDAD